MTDIETYRLSTEHAAEALRTHLASGLTTEQARDRFGEHGPNELIERSRPGFFRLLLGQFNNFLIILLVVAAFISLALGEVVDAVAILAIVILNAVLGVVQESKAEQALAALKKMSAPTAQVIREGHQQTIAGRELVPGDIVVLEAGNYIPADLRLIESVNLKIEEASLTGESMPAEKDSDVVLDGEVPVGDRRNSAYMSTLVTYGRGKGMVTATGMHTQIGMIAEMIQSYEEEPTPLQRKLDQLGRTLGIFALLVSALIFGIGVLRDTQLGLIGSQGLLAYLTRFSERLVDLFMTAVSLAIAAVPEGLPAVVTICLALGMQRMVRRHALLRRLPAVETLGSATVICSDKTGTLTQNQMTVVRGWAGGSVFDVTGEGYAPDGRFEISGEPYDPRSDQATTLLLAGGMLCNDARLEESGEDGGKTTWRMVGDPTEGALVVAAAKAMLWREEVEARLPRIKEIPFDSDRKCMTTIHRVEQASPLAASAGLTQSRAVAFIKGAPGILLDHCTRLFERGQVVALTDDRRLEIMREHDAMAGAALRVLGVAYRPLEEIPEAPTPEQIERELTFVGLQGMMDPPRPEVSAAVRVAKGAGVRSVMITGDAKETAVAVANAIGLIPPGGRVLTGTELDQMDEEQLAAMVDHVGAYARVSPQHKVKIVDAFKARGQVVAMTGDGVNDAPALKRASIGIAMGITGTDVSKETADMVLTDDNYASIVSAIEEGRTIYANIRKFVFYLISCNIGEILLIFGSMVAGLPLPLRPIQLLWLNLVTDGAPALALGVERGDPDIMKRRPRPVAEPVINREMLIGVVVQAIVMTAAVMLSFLYGLRAYPDNLAEAQTVTFATLIMSELLRAFTSRSERHSVFSIGFFSNPWMVGAVLSSFLLLLAVIYVPFLDPVFQTVPLTLRDWLVITPLMLMAATAAEITKWFVRLWARKEERQLSQS
jgi:P-type Ca2+ transporter type 2C